MHATDTTINHCIWDTGFFGIPVGKCTLASGDACTPELIGQMRNKGFRLVYLFAPEPLSNIDAISATCDIVHADIRHQYRLTIAQRIQLSACIAVQNYTGTLTEQLYELAVTAGHQSRFQTDKHFPPHTMPLMYGAWLAASINGEMGDWVLITGTPENPEGLITLKARGNSAHIGLIAVAENKKGKGVGTALVDSAITRAQQQGAETISVITQAANTQACRFYTHLGFQLVERNWIYHIWL